MEAYGTIDELNSVPGVARLYVEALPVNQRLGVEGVKWIYKR
ncbi:hypothetical protein MNV_60082 [Candidatus Methanoperedens nitroreducens]|uniref:Uncharacterized protein n=1 Tax=Candidatus Methanoperedens nitratireducens TaxID=1392998 RepID=A0A284VSD5_9EURY|nr:hypothetical protein MNV_60082 [Candidatus Methanoperedens nitroreducens]